MKLKDVINYDRMQQFLEAPIEWFHQFGDVSWSTASGWLIYKDNNSPILSVAHLDSVNDFTHFHVCEFAGNDIVFNTHLDDRLGAYLILEVLPQMGIHADILLTEGEETGNSTAKYFMPNKEYHWMFSFDRRGIDVVHYRYTMKDWLDALEKMWQKQIFHGSNSDIDYLSHLNCCGMNVGTGYYNEHHLMAYANMSELRGQLGKFIQFYQTNKRTRYEYIKPTYVPYIPVNPPPKPSVPATNTNLQPDEKLTIKDFNPYEGMIVDTPLDIDTYISPEGVIEWPSNCAFCLEKIYPNNLHVFTGICKDCERWAVLCVCCNEYFCRTDNPLEDMDEELYFGTCSVCSERRNLIENSRFQNPSTRRTFIDGWDDTEDESDLTG